jgi:hypothetical protein
MIKISHRGNIDGPKPELENSPEYIYDAIGYGFEVEIDIWLVDDVYYLGHSSPQYRVDDSFILEVIPYAWFHCKNLKILDKFLKMYSHARFFWHQEDDFALTSNRYIWTYPGKDTSDRTIIVHLDKFREDQFQPKPFGVCSDFLL